MERSLVIIGAGVAGLTAGCYAARSGYRTTIVEMHDLPGGLCTSWRRHGFLFDASAAGLAGSSPESPFFRLWKDIGVADGCPLHDPDSFGSVRAPDGRTATVYTNVDRLEEHFLELFPGDAVTVRAFTAAVRQCMDIDIPFRSREGWEGMKEGLRAAGKSVRSLPALRRWSRVSLRELVSCATARWAVS